MLKVNNYTLYTNKDKNFNILFFTDIHYSSKFKLEKQIITKVKQIKSDYICITGDIIDSTQILEEKNKELKELFKNLSKEAKILIVLGNHDLENIKHHMHLFQSRMLKWKAFLKPLKNIYLLDNDYYIDDKINVLGITLSQEYYYQKPYESVNVLNKILLDIKPSFNNNTYNIVMLHSPRSIVHNKNLHLIKGADLILCGHMHDGMMPKVLKKLPTSRGLISPQKTLFPKYARGLINEKIDNHEIKLLISGGVTKIGNGVPTCLKLFDFCYNSDMELIKIRSKDE